MIRRVLVANRGEIARRIFRTCRRLGIETVAVFSEPDVDAPFVGDADVAVALGGATPADSYLRIDALLAAAQRTGADAIHPGYGFLAERADFAEAVLGAGLVWIGPSPEAIAAMGDKTEARDRMAGAGVPVLPGARLTGDETPGMLERIGERIGYPLLVKAAAGGGGKGMRRVDRPADLLDAMTRARHEAASAFGVDTLFLERFLERSRHVEVQIFGDHQGTVVSLHERDCSVQRRHQKIIEESPSPAVDAALRQDMGEAAILAGSALAYVGAGTVEFLLDEHGEFAFLEMNARLQVEHPVTELVTGLDLVELQLLVAEGRPLPAAVRAAPLRGHAIEARIYAEDATRGFLPRTGTVSRFVVPDGLRVDSGIESGSEISPYYDPMIAKVIAHGATREDAARRLADGLARIELDGLVTNRELLVRILRTDEFLDGRADTSFFERNDPATLAAPLLPADVTRLAAAALTLARQAGRREGAKSLASLPTGWRNNPSTPLTAEFHTTEDTEIHVSYRFGRDGRLASLALDGTPCARPRLHGCTPSLVDLEVDGIRRRYEIAGSVVGTASGRVELTEVDRFPPSRPQATVGALAAPMPGAILRVAVAPGDEVHESQLLVVLEAMKMEHEVVAPRAGRVAEVRVQEGAQVAGAEILVVLDAEDPG